MSRPGGWLDRWGDRIALICVLGTCACFAGLGYLQVQVRSQASEGAKARTRQQRVYPVSLKLYEDAYERGVISRVELACFRGDPRACEQVRRQAR